MEYNCLPRLIDALLTPAPAFAFPASSCTFTSPERRRQEHFLGFEPENLRRFWCDQNSDLRTGSELQIRWPVPNGSAEYEAVKTIFLSKPSVKRFYFADFPTSRLSVASIERIENKPLNENTQTCFINNRKALENLNVEFEEGVHIQWLFHGAGSADVVDKIVSNPVNGFKPMVSFRALWGDGNYFARDVTYPVRGGFCKDCKDSEGNLMMVLCLVIVGVPCVGQAGMKNAPKVRIRACFACVHICMCACVHTRAWLDSTTNSRCSILAQVHRSRDTVDACV